MLGKGTTSQKLVNTVNRQKSSNVGTQVAGDRDPNRMSCDNLFRKDFLCEDSLHSAQGAWLNYNLHPQSGTDQVDDSTKLVAMKVHSNQ